MMRIYILLYSLPLAVVDIVVIYSGWYRLRAYYINISIWIHTSYIVGLVLPIFFFFHTGCLMAVPAFFYQTKWRQCIFYWCTNIFWLNFLIIKLNVLNLFSRVIVLFFAPIAFMFSSKNEAFYNFLYFSFECIFIFHPTRTKNNMINIWPSFSQFSVGRKK